MIDVDLPDREIFRLARGSIEYGLVHRAPLPVNLDEVPEALRERGATFTTLRVAGDLRGCCGNLEARFSLAEDVSLSAFQAAFHDARFDPVREDELPSVRLEVSVLSPLESLLFTDEADLLDQLVPGRDGLVIIAGVIRATLLPSVWQSRPDPRQFLAALKIKCGLAADFWSEQLEFRRYQTSCYAES